MAWPFDNNVESVLPIDYGVQQAAKYANNAIGNNQNNPGLSWWMNADQGRYKDRINDPNWQTSDGSVGRWNYQPQEETIVEEEVYPKSNDLDANWQHQLRMQGIDRGNIDNRWYDNIKTPVMAGLGWLRDKFQRPEAKQRFYDEVMQGRSLEPWQTGMYKGNEYGLYQSPTGLKVSSDVIGWGPGYEKNLDSLFGSKSIEEMEDKKIDWAMNRLANNKRISQRLTNVLKDRGLIGGDGDRRGGTDYITRKNTASDYGHTRFQPGSGYYGEKVTRSAPSRFDGAPDRTTYDRSPTDYSGSFNKGGRVGLYQGGDPTQWMTEEEKVTPFQLQQEEGVDMGLMASDDVNTRILENLFEKYLDLGYSPMDAERLAMEEFESMAKGPQEEVVEEGIARLV